MADRCKQCGAETLPAMKYCRFCGAPTSSLSAREKETQSFPSRPPTEARSSSVTTPVYLPPDVVASEREASSGPKQRRRRWPWVLGLLLGFIFLALALAGYGVYQGVTQIGDIHVSEGEEGIEITKGGRKITIHVPNEVDVSSNPEILTRTLPLSPGGTFRLSNIRGDIRITAWDEDHIELTAKTQAKTAKARRQIDININDSAPQRVSVQTSLPSKSGARVDYDVKLPRQANIELIRTVSGDVNIEGVQGGIAVETVSGDIDLRKVLGHVSTRSVSGDANVQVGQSADAEGMSFGSISGDLTIEFLDEFNANLSLSTTTGSITAEGGIQVFIERGFGNKSAHGRVGQGGGPVINVNTVSGDIRLIH